MDGTDDTAAETGAVDGDPDRTAAESETPPGWTLWNDEPRGRRILVFRPDVFNENNDLPAECIPTIMISNRSRAQRPGAAHVPTETWHVVLTLEPEIEAVVESYDSREAAVEGAADLGQRFADGDVDYREPYQVPRESYFARLDAVLSGDE